MRQTIKLALCVLAAMFAAAPAVAQQPLKIGVILPYSGQFADGATQLDNGIKLYVQQHGDTIAGRKIEIIRRDIIARDSPSCMAALVKLPDCATRTKLSTAWKRSMAVDCQS